MDVKGGLMEQKHMTRSHQLGARTVLYCGYVLAWGDRLAEQPADSKISREETLFDVPVTGIKAPKPQPLPAKMMAKA